MIDRIAGSQGDAGTEWAWISLAIFAGATAAAAAWLDAAIWLDLTGLRCRRAPVLRDAAAGPRFAVLPARPGSLAPGDRIHPARGRPPGWRPGRTGTEGPGSRSSAPAMRSGQLSGFAAATCRSFPAIVVITSKWRLRSCGARAPSSITSKASFATIPASGTGRGCSTTGQRRWTHTCVRSPSGSRDWGEMPPSTRGLSPPRGAASSSTCLPSRALRLRSPALRLPRSRSGRWPRWPFCRSTRSTPASYCGKAWWR